MTLREEFRTVRTVDNWCPNIDGDKIRLHLLMVKFPDYKNYRVKLVAHGGDDTDAELFFEDPDINKANLKYFEFKGIMDSVPDGVDFKWFDARGFT